MNLKYDEKTKSKSGATIGHCRITHLSDFAAFDYHPKLFGFIMKLLIFQINEVF
jgi:hypothetical protein